MSSEMNRESGRGYKRTVEVPWRPGCLDGRPVSLDGLPVTLDGRLVTEPFFQPLAAPLEGQ